MFVLTVALQRGAGLGPVPAGLALAPMAVAFFAGSLAGPRLVARFGARVVTAGSVIQGVGVVLIIVAVRANWPDVGFVELLPGAAVAGAGQALQLPVIMRIVMSQVPPERAGVGSGVLVTTQQASLALGVATLGTLFLSLAPDMGMQDALVATLAVQLAGVVVTALWSLRLPHKVG